MHRFLLEDRVPGFLRSCQSAVKTLLWAPRPSISSITYLYGGRASREVVRVRRPPLSMGEAKKVFILVSFWEDFHRRSIGYSEFEVVVASSLRQSEFLCMEACHAPIEDAIFWRASPWKHALGKYGIENPRSYAIWFNLPTCNNR